MFVWFALVSQGASLERANMAESFMRTDRIPGLTPEVRWGFPRLQDGAGEAPAKLVQHRARMLARQT
jgi:hypothetical protein